MTAQYGRKSCAKCPSTFELVPPADPEYSIPREKPKSNDYIERFYECEEERHRNTIYWEKEERVTIVSGEYKTEPLRSRQRFGRAEGSSLLERGHNPRFD
jgi:hypothetical protein